MRAHRRRDTWQAGIHHLPIALRELSPGFAFTRRERVYLRRVFLSRTSRRHGSVGVVSELIRGDGFTGGR